MATRVLTTTKSDRSEIEARASAPPADEAQPRVRARRGRYISDSIIERRRRILESAKSMIAEGGPEGFTIRELGRRAGVSVTTIYATYGDKEGLIAAAIQDYYDGLPVGRARESTSMPGVMAAIDLACDAILANKPYARQYAALCFSGTVDPRIYRAVQDTVTDAGRVPWLQKALREGDVIPGLSYEQNVNMIANSRLMVLQDWAQGRITDEDLGWNMKLSFLVQARGMTRGSTQARIEAEMKKQLRAFVADAAD